MRNIICKMCVLTFVVCLWQIFYLFPCSQNFLIPAPVEIANSFFLVTFSGEIIEHLFASLNRVIVGFLIASILGITLGLLFGYSSILVIFIGPIIEILRPIPPIAWIPIAILLFGLGNSSSYFIVFLGAFFPIFTNTVFGVTSLPQIYKHLALTLEISKFSYFKNILFKFSLPYIFTGLKIGIGMAWMSVIAAELIGAQSGLGYFIQINRLLLATDKIIVGMILIGLSGYALHKIICLIEIVAIPWKVRKNVKNQ